MTNGMPKELIALVLWADEFKVERIYEAIENIQVNKLKVKKRAIKPFFDIAAIFFNI